MAVVVYGLGLLCIAATLVPLSKHEAWWVRACDFPRLQIVACLVVALALLLAFGDFGQRSDQLLALAVLACLAYQLAVILPYTPLWSVEVLGSRAPPGDRALKMLIVNVLMSNRRSDALFAEIGRHAPDLVLALEVDAWWAERFEQLAESHPHRIAHPLDNTYGVLLYSSLELIEPEVRFLLKPDIPSIRSEVRLRSNDTFALYGLHPEPPGPTEADTSLPRDAELVIVAREVAEANRTSIVAGDLNDVAWSHTSRLFRRISRLLDPRVGRGMFNSFHARYWPLRWPLDHVFVSDDFVVESIRRLPAFGSDHFPILITLAYAAAAAELQEAPEDDVEDHAEAARKLEVVIACMRCGQALESLCRGGALRSCRRRSCPTPGARSRSWRPRSQLPRRARPSLDPHRQLAGPARASGPGARFRPWRRWSQLPRRARPCAAPPRPPLGRARASGPAFPPPRAPPRRLRRRRPAPSPSARGPPPRRGA